MSGVKTQRWLFINYEIYLKLDTWYNLEVGMLIWTQTRYIPDTNQAVVASKEQNQEKQYHATVWLPPALCFLPLDEYPRWHLTTFPCPVDQHIGYDVMFDLP